MSDTNTYCAIAISRLALSRVFCSSIVMVMGPTPPRYRGYEAGMLLGLLEGHVSHQPVPAFLAGVLHTAHTSIGAQTKKG